MKVNLQRPEAYVSGSFAFQTSTPNASLKSDALVTVAFLDAEDNEINDLNAEDVSLRVINYSFPLLYVKKLAVLNYQILVYYNNVLIYEKKIKEYQNSSAVSRSLDLARYITDPNVKENTEIEVVVYPLNSNLNAYGDYISSNIIRIKNPKLDPKINQNTNLGFDCVHLLDKENYFVYYKNFGSTPDVITGIEISNENFVLSQEDQDHLRETIIVQPSSIHVFTITFQPSLMLGRGYISDIYANMIFEGGDEVLQEANLIGKTYSNFLMHKHPVDNNQAAIDGVLVTENGDYLVHTKLNPCTDKFPSDQDS